MARYSMATGASVCLMVLVACVVASRVILEHDITPRVPDGWSRTGAPRPDASVSLLFVMRLQNLEALKVCLID
jgi:hypothetical protein